jgi:uncharacterized C2H2 Zn-finger protein
MKTYKCPRCGYLTNQRNDLRKHLRRKIICQPLLDNVQISECLRTILNEDTIIPEKNAFKCVENGCHVPQKCVQMRYDAFKCVGNNEQENVIPENICSACGAIFKHKRYLSQHINRYKCKKNNILEKIKIIENLKKENEVLKNNKNTTIQNNTINNTVIINAFGKENLDYINKEYIHGLIKEGPYGSIRKLIKYIHFNPDHKENHNIKIPNKRDKYAMVYDGSMWQVKNKKNMITTIADHAYGVIAEHCEDITSKKFDRFRDDFESEESRYMKRLAEDTELIILNGQKEIGIL